jgi:signal transduction histidine kinase
LFSTRQGEIELAVLPLDEEDWRVVASLPTGPVAIDAWAVFEEHDGALDVAHLLSLMVLALGMAALGVALIVPPARHLQRLARTARALEGGDFAARAEEPRGGLVAPVARAMNDMAAQIQQVVAWQELMLQIVAHELRTPLSRVRFVVERVADATDQAERNEAMETLDGELTELEELLSSVLAMVRADHGAATGKEPVDLREVIEGALDTLARHQEGRDHPLHIERIGLQPVPPLVRVDRAAATRVFDNLLSNAAAHAHQYVRVVATVEGDSLMIAVEDDGEGLLEEQRGRIFAPFVRLGDGETRMGVGLGLTIVKRLVEAHGYPISVVQSELGGLRVETRWPLAIEQHQEGDR